MATFLLVLDKGLLPSAPARNTEIPSVSPVCPSTKILLPLLSNDGRERSDQEFSECYIMTSIAVEQLLVLLPQLINRVLS